MQHGQNPTWNECNTKKCVMKREQHDATREKLQHEKSARVKYVKKSAQE